MTARLLSLMVVPESQRHVVPESQSRWWWSPRVKVGGP